MNPLTTSFGYVSFLVIHTEFIRYETKIGQISHCGLVPILTGTPPWSTSGEDIMPISSKWDTLKKK